MVKSLAKIVRLLNDESRVTQSSFLALRSMHFPGYGICLQRSHITINSGYILILCSLMGSATFSNQYHHFLLLRIVWRRHRRGLSNLDRRELIRSEAGCRRNQSARMPPAYRWLHVEDVVFEGTQKCECGQNKQTPYAHCLILISICQWISVPYIKKFSYSFLHLANISIELLCKI